MKLHVIQRSCGECSVCCDYVAIDELQKPARTPCRHLMSAGHGCSIYENPSRPNVCHDFQCAWRRGSGREEDRPDRIGTMVSINRVENGIFALFTRALAAVQAEGRWWYADPNGPHAFGYNAPFLREKLLRVPAGAEPPPDELSQYKKQVEEQQAQIQELQAKYVELQGALEKATQTSLASA